MQKERLRWRQGHLEPKGTCDNRIEQKNNYGRPSASSSPNDFASSLTRSEFNGYRRSGNSRVRWQALAPRSSRRENGGRS
jgi:hypothetical protein